LDVILETRKTDGPWSDDFFRSTKGHFDVNRIKISIMLNN
jgi:hypothetical protein